MNPTDLAATSKPRELLLGKPSARVWLIGRKNSAGALLTWAGLSLIAGIGLGLRLFHLGRASLWLDEAATAALVAVNRRSFWQIIFKREMNMAPYYCILRLVLRARPSETQLRLLSVLFGTAIIFAVWFLARHVLTHCEGRSLWALVAASLAAVNGFLIAYSREARGYAMALCLLVLATCAARTLIRNGRLRITWCLLAISTIYSHFYTVLWIAPQVWAIWSANKHRGRKFFYPIALIAALGLIPLLVFAVQTRGGQLDWVPKLTPTYFLEIFVQLAGYSRIALLLLLIGSVIGCVRLHRRGDIFSRMVVLETALPVVMLLMFSVAHPVFVPRFLIFMIPFLILTAIEGFIALGTIGGSSVAVSTFAVMLLASNQAPAKGDWRSMDQYLCGQQGQPIAFWPSMQKLPYWYYTGSTSSCPAPLFPAERNVSIADFQPNRHEFEAKLCASQAKSVLIVVDPGAGPQKGSEVRAACYTAASMTVRGGLQMVLLQRKK